MRSMSAAQTARVVNVQSEPLRSPEPPRTAPQPQYPGFEPAPSLVTHVDPAAPDRGRETGLRPTSSRKRSSRTASWAPSSRCGCAMVSVPVHCEKRRGSSSFAKSAACAVGPAADSSSRCRPCASLLRCSLRTSVSRERRPEHLLEAYRAVGEVALKRVRRAAIACGGQHARSNDQAPAPSERSRLLTYVASRTDSSVLRMIAECLDSLTDLVPTRRPLELRTPAFLPCELDCRAQTLAALDAGDQHEARRLFVAHERHANREWIDKTLALTPWFV